MKGCLEGKELFWRSHGKAVILQTISHRARGQPSCLLNVAFGLASSAESHSHFSCGENTSRFKTIVDPAWSHLKVSLLESTPGPNLSVLKHRQQRTTQRYKDYTLSLGSVKGFRFAWIR